MIRLTLPGAAAAAALGLTALAFAACASHAAPSPSKVTTAYKLKVDDAVRESASVRLVTTKGVLISADCAPLAAGDAAAERAIAVGLAARLPANVTIYTTPYDPVTLDSLPDVVTDDGYGGKLCTPHSFTIVNGP